MINSYPIYYSDCAHFRGDVPCRPHKDKGVHCAECDFYDPRDGIVLIIKLGAIGDVIRTTPLLHKIWEERPPALVWWLTYTPEVVPAAVDKAFSFTPESLTVLRATAFRTVINLDKDPQACALTALLESEKKYGFILRDGKPAPIDDRAEHKFLTGLYDDLNQANTKSYLEEIFEVCGYEFNGEEYILDCEETRSWDIPSGGKPIVGLNTGCGERWVSRLWKEEYWSGLIAKLSSEGFFPLLLGGAQEHEKNIRLARETGALYLGHFSLKEFISLVDRCDLIVTGVTMGLHIAVGLKKSVALMNNIFNKNEFELYGRGEIVEPSKPCRCFFSPECKNPDYFCMDSLSVDSVLEALKKCLRKS